jgi:hypothetical protein
MKRPGSPARFPLLLILPALAIGISMLFIPYSAGEWVEVLDVRGSLRTRDQFELPSGCPAQGRCAHGLVLEILGSTTASPGQTLDLALRIDNTGPDLISDVGVYVLIGADLQDLTHPFAQANGGSGDLGPGARAEVPFTVPIPAVGNDHVQISANARGAAAGVEIHSQAIHDLIVRASVSFDMRCPPTAAPEQPIRYEFRLTNLGEEPVTEAMVTAQEIGFASSVSSFLFHDEFEARRLSQSWAAYGETGAWAIAPVGEGNRGLVHASSDTERASDALFVPSGADWRDYSLTSDIQFEGDGDWAAGVGLRIDSASGAGYWLWIGSMDGTLALWKSPDWEPAGPSGSRVAIAAIDLAPGWHHLQVDLVGDRIQVAWDGREKIVIHDDQFADGTVALQAESSQATQGASIRFDNLAIFSNPALLSPGETIVMSTNFQVPSVAEGVLEIQATASIWNGHGLESHRARCQVPIRTKPEEEPRAQNNPPIGHPDEYQTPQGESLIIPNAIGVLQNDEDADGDVLQARLTENPQHGLLAFSADGSFSYAPEPNFLGDDRFTYALDDGKLRSEPVPVILHVEPMNQAPIASDDRYTLPQDTKLAIPSPGPMANDSDPDGDALTIELVLDAEHGLLDLSADGQFTYSPAAGYVGEDAFSYLVTDGRLKSDAATVALEIVPANHPPIAADDGIAIQEGTTVVVAILDNDSDPDGDALLVISAAPAEHGSLILGEDGAVTYTPDPGYVGAETIRYLVQDTMGGQAEATLTIDILPAPFP